MNKLKILLLQFNIEWEDAMQNLEKLDSTLNGKTNDAQIIILPEAFNSGFSMDIDRVAETKAGKTLQWMKETAAKYNCAVCGSMFIKENEGAFNRFYWIQPNGETISYDKRHLFAYSGENQQLTPGSKRVVIDYLGWKIFPQICYDLRFPVWSRNNLDYDLFINVANWPSARKDVWQTLLKARALENLCYVIGVNRTGTDGNEIEYMGESMAFDAKGNELIRMGPDESLAEIVVSKDELIAFREKFNVLNDRDSFLLAF